MSSSTLAERLLIFSQRYPLLPKDRHFFAYKIEKREKVVGRLEPPHIPARHPPQKIPLSVQSFEKMPLENLVKSKKIFSFA